MTPQGIPQQIVVSFNYDHCQLVVYQNTLMKETLLV
jgi:hypothetical protein